MPKMTRLSLDRATITRLNDGSVQVDDPGCPLIVTLVVDRGSGRLVLSSLRVDARDGVRVTAKLLAGLPLPQLAHVAALRQGAPLHPNEAHYASLVRPKPAGERDWPDEHWPLVLDVYQWATDTGRPGGGYAAIADLWCVAKRPTAYRWVARARRECGVSAPGEHGPSV